MFDDSRIHRLLATLALSVALCIALLAPLGYAFVSYRALVESLDTKARLSAGRVARQIFSSPRLWEFQVTRLSEVIEFAAFDRINHRQTILDKDNRAVLTESTIIQMPSISRTAPIIVNDVPVGTIKIETSLRPFLWEATFVALIAMLLAALSYGAFHRFPLRAFYETMERLAKERERVNEALDDLRASEAKLMLQGKELADVQRVARLGGWSMRPDGTDLVVSDQTLEVLRITLDQAAHFVSYLEPGMNDDTARAFQALVRKVVKSLEINEMDFRFRRPDQLVIDIQIRLWPIEVKGNWVLRIGGTLQDISKTKEAERQLEQLAYFDPLTGLANRTLFKRELSGELERLKHQGGDAALLLIDLDRFKDVNDSLGHAAGDLLLTRVAQFLKCLMPEEAIISRLGGDEFAIILRGQAERERISALAQSIIDAVEEPIVLGRSEAKIGASIGIVRLLKDADDAETLVKYADLALYQAKGRGRGCYAFFENEMDELIQYKVLLARDLRLAAAENKGLEVWFQPLLALEGRKIHGFEALMRWNHPRLGYIPPSEFIPIAESSSLISDLGNWILRETALTAKAWIDAGGEAYEVSVNLSPAQIWQSDLEAEVAAILDETGLPPHLLCLELTESVFVDHSEVRVKQVLQGLKKLGVALALDDFGTGYSSLAYLTQLPFDKLKIDRAFVQGAPISAKGRRVLEGIIALGHGLGMTVVAEGIEQENELAILEAARCDLIQGYLIARPRPAAEALIEGARLVRRLQSVLVEENAEACSGNNRLALSG
jgi:diguanylate cyclase (GGDEF)-like protein